MARLRDRGKLDVENECRIRRNVGNVVSVAVGKVRWNHQYALAAHVHPQHAIAKPGDGVAQGQIDGSRESLVNARAVPQKGSVVDEDRPSGRQRRPRTDGLSSSTTLPF